MGKFHDIPYHLALPDIEAVKAYQWLIAQFEYPSSKQAEQSLRVTQLLRKLVFEMTKKKQLVETTNAKGKKQYVETIWLSVRLTTNDEAALTEYSVSAVEIIDDLLLLVADGGGFTVKQTADGESYNAYAFLPVGTDDANAYAISAFAGNPADALLVLHYKLFVLVKDNPVKWTVTEKRRFG